MPLVRSERTEKRIINLSCVWGLCNSLQSFIKMGESGPVFFCLSPIARHAFIYFLNGCCSHTWIHNKRSFITPSVNQASVHTVFITSALQRHRSISWPNGPLLLKNAPKKNKIQTILFLHFFYPIYNLLSNKYMNTIVWNIYNYKIWHSGSILQEYIYLFYDFRNQTIFFKQIYILLWYGLIRSFNRLYLFWCVYCVLLADFWHPFKPAACVGFWVSGNFSPFSDAALPTGFLAPTKMFVQKITVD